jgi:hypothetical protein
MPQSSAFSTLAGWCMYASGVVAAIGVLFLALLYLGFLTGREGLYQFGPLNDVCVLLQYLLALPAVISLYRQLGGQSPFLSRLALVLALVGIIAVAVFQVLLLTGIMPFSKQVWFVSASIFLIGGWILINSYLGRSSGSMPVGVPVSVLAFFYFGYPFWAFQVGGFLLIS